MKRTSTVVAVFTKYSLAMVVLAILAAANLAEAADGTWTGTANTDFTNVNNWASGTVPNGSAAGNTAIFGSSLTTYQPSLFGNRSVYGLVFEKVDGGWSLGGSAYTLTLGVGGITNLASSGTTTINANLSLGGSMTWTNCGGALVVNGRTTFSSAGRTLTVGGGTVTLTNLDSASSSDGFGKSGAGTLVLPNAAGANLQGTFTIAAGTLILGNKNALGLGSFKIGSSAANITIEASTDLSGANAIANSITWVNSVGGATNIFSGANNITLSGNQTGGASGSTLVYGNTLDSGKTLLLSGNVTVDAANNLGFRVTGTGDTEFSGNLYDYASTGGKTSSWAIAATGAGIVTFSGSNSYYGATTVNSGVLRLNSANSLSANSALTIGTGGGVLGLGTGDFTRDLATTPAAGQAALKGTAGFAAYGANRQVNFGGAGATQTWNSTGFMVSSVGAFVLGADTADKTVTLVNPLNFGVAGNSRTVQVNNASAEIDGVLAGALGGAAVWVKTGAGTLELRGANTLYSGTTTVSQGELRVSSSTGSGLVTVNSGASISGTGTVASLTLDSGAILKVLNVNGTAGLLHVTGAVTTLPGAATVDATALSASLSGTVPLITAGSSIGGSVDGWTVLPANRYVLSISGNQILMRVRLPGFVFMLD